MNIHNTTIDTRGFISVAALLIMMASLSVVMAIVYRSAQGGVITRNLKQSNQAYQQGDNIVEQLIQEIRLVDNDNPTNGNSPFPNKIPDSILASSICGLVTNGRCYISSATLSVGASNEITATSTVNDIVQVSGSSTSATTERSLQVPVPVRVPIPAIVDSATGNNTGLALENSSAGNVVISWKALSKNPDNDTYLPEYDQLEIRRADISSVPDTTLPDVLLKDPTLDWNFVGTVPASDATSGMPSSGIALPPDTTFVEDTGLTVGNTYAYIIKATNKNPLKLDSYYSLPEIIKISL